MTEYNFPADIKLIFDIITRYGSCYLCGGAVRDIIMNIEPHDYDFCTNLIPSDIEEIFKKHNYKTIPTGKEYGTITVMINNIGYEVTTFRSESEYADGRRPSVINFANTIEEDLSRRDFTINAIAMNTGGDIIDPYNGRKDLENGMIVCVGKAVDRFNEDKLRLLRAFRFASKYDFDISSFTKYDMYKYDSIGRRIGAYDISNLSSERIRDEFNKIIVCNNPSKTLRLMKNMGYLEQIIDKIDKTYEFNQNNKYHSKDVFEHTLDVMDNVENDYILRLASLFHDIGKPNSYTVDENNCGHFYEHNKVSETICIEVMMKLRYSKEEVKLVSKLVYNHMRHSDKPNIAYCKRLINVFDGDMENLDRLFKLQVADMISCNGNKFSGLRNIYLVKSMCEKIISEKLPIGLKDLKINGNDLIELGYKGKEIGIKLNECLEMIIEDSELNEREGLLDYCNQ